MVGEAVQDYKSGIIESEEKHRECKVELPINAHLAPEYVPGERLRLDLYRRLADVTTDEAVDEIHNELVDRFGALPPEAEKLLGVARLRGRAKSVKLTEVVLQGKYLRLAPITLSESLQLKLMRVYPGSIYKSTTNSVLVALPSAKTWAPSSPGALIGDTSLLPWATEAIENVTIPISPTKES